MQPERFSFSTHFLFLQDPVAKMTTEQIVDEIGEAGSWLPLITVRRAFTDRETLAPILLQAVEGRAAAKDGRNIRNHRLATFGIFFLALIRDRRLFEPLVQLFESANPEAEEEWLFHYRLVVYGWGGLVPR